MNEILLARTTGDVHTITNLPSPIPTAIPLAGPTKTPLRSRFAEAGRVLMAPPALPGPREEEQGETTRHATISCIIPAYNEQDTIAEVLESLLAQTRMPDVIHVIVNNTDDGTLEVCAPFVGHHERIVKGVRFETRIFVHDMGENSDKKVGALNFGFRLSRNFDYILGVDGDTTLDRRAVEYLELEMVDDPRIGGISAIYSIDKSKSGGRQRFLVAGQRAQFAGFNMDNLLRGRNMAVLGGQCSLFSRAGSEGRHDRYHQRRPWVRDSEVEDSCSRCRSRTSATAPRSAPGPARSSAP